MQYLVADSSSKPTHVGGRSIHQGIAMMTLSLMGGWMLHSGEHVIGAGDDETCISRHDIVIINSMLGINKPAGLCQAGRQGADHICRDSGRTSRVLGIRDESISKTLVTTSPHVLLVQQQTSSSPRREVSPSHLPYLRAPRIVHCCRAEKLGVSSLPINQCAHNAGYLQCSEAGPSAHRKRPPSSLGRQ